MISWDYYRYFLEIERQGSLKLAAKKLGVNQTTVGRNLSSLEDSIGSKLFERRPDGFILTALGSRILETMQLAEEKMLQADRQLAGQDQNPEGQVKITMPGALANHWFIPLAQPLLIKYPKLNLDFLTGPEVLNLVRREADLALRLVKPTQRDLVSKKMGTLKLVLAGHKNLFKNNSKPKTVENLMKFQFIGLYDFARSKAEQDLLDRCKDAINISMRSAAWSSVFSAVSSGIGIGILPSFMLKKDKQMQQILPELTVSMPLWLVYHPDLRNSMRIRVVIEYLDSCMKDDLK